MPSLSVVHVDPSVRRNDAPAYSSPPKPIVPLINPSTNHLKPTGTSTSLRPMPGDHPVDDRTAHRGLADRRGAGPVRPVGVEVVDRHGQVVVRVHQPAVGGDDAVPVGVGVVAGRDLVVVPISPISEAIALGELQSIRILPSVSRVMNRHVASTSGLTTVRSRLCARRSHPSSRRWHRRVGRRRSGCPRRGWRGCRRRWAGH